jgi:hypothetical protein
MSPFGVYTIFRSATPTGPNATPGHHHGNQDVPLVPYMESFNARNFCSLDLVFI